MPIVLNFLDVIRTEGLVFRAGVGFFCQLFLAVWRDIMEFHVLGLSFATNTFILFGVIVD